MPFRAASSPHSAHRRTYALTSHTEGVVDQSIYFRGRFVHLFSVDQSIYFQELLRTRKSCQLILEQDASEETLASASPCRVISTLCV